MKQLSFIVVGAGNRGLTYTKNMLAMPEKYKVVGVADPNPEKCARYRRRYGITEEQCFSDWHDILAKPKMADIAIIATSDMDHYEPAMKAISLGYDILLEKPVAPTERECCDIANAAREAGVKIIVCHVLRYTPFYKKIKSIIKSGMIGEVMSIEQTEAIGDRHFAHSFVRGNWGNTDRSAPMLLAKTCHDIDIIQWLMDKKCEKVSSFGSLTYFTEQNAPAGAPVHCYGGDCPEYENCPYASEKIYIDDAFGDWFKGSFRNSVGTHNDFTDDELREELKTSNYGKCVFHAGNNLCDHQVMNMQFCGGATAQLTVNAFNSGGRHTRVYGTKGELWAYMSDTEITVHTFADNKKHFMPVQETEEAITGGHGGGDAGMIFDLYDYLTGGYEGFSVADIDVSVYNHMLGFAAEESRHTDTTVKIDEFCKKFEFEY